MKPEFLIRANFINSQHYKVSGAFFIFALLLPWQGLFALNMEITGRELGFSFRAEYNRTFHFSHDYAIFGGIELNNRYAFSTGFAVGKLGDETEIKAFSSGHFTPLVRLPLNLNFSYVYNGLPGFRMHSHSILTFFSYNWRRAGIALGFNFRYTSFFGEAFLFEPMLVFSVYFNFVNTERFTLGIKCGNFSEFYIGNLSQFSYSLNGTLRLNQNWSLWGELEMAQSGNFIFAATFYKFAYTGGVRFSW